MYTPHWQWKLLSSFMVILQPLYSTPAADARLCCPLVVANETYQLSVGKELGEKIICRYEDLQGDCTYDKEEGCPMNDIPSCPKTAVNTIGSFCYPYFPTKCCDIVHGENLMEVYQYDGKFECMYVTASSASTYRMLRFLPINYSYTFAKCIYDNNGTLKKGRKDCPPRAAEPPTKGYCSTFVKDNHNQPTCGGNHSVVVDGSQ